MIVSAVTVCFLYKINFNLTISQIERKLENKLKFIIVRLYIQNWSKVTVFSVNTSIDRNVMSC